ncbi:MAG: DUF1292 domain-containing protein [Oscillospiraceae bacterium]|nr:DUF1292 domain-containing protein [Oscillospiraceae bacterium]
MEKEKITLEFDDGAVLELEIVGIFDVKGVEYIALFDPEKNEDYLYRYIDKGEDFDLDEIPEDEFDEVCTEYEKIMDSLEE